MRLNPAMILVHFVVPIFIWGCIIRVGMEIVR